MGDALLALEELSDLIAEAEVDVLTGGISALLIVVVEVLVILEDCMETAACLISGLRVVWLSRGCAEVGKILLSGTCVLRILRIENIFVVSDASYLASLVAS
jgi:hypothetical protein